MFNQSQTTWAYEFFVEESIREMLVYSDLHEKKSLNEKEEKQKEKIEKKVKKQLKKYPYMFFSPKSNDVFFCKKNPLVVYKENEGNQKFVSLSKMKKKIQKEEISYENIDFFVPKKAVFLPFGKYDIRCCSLVESQYPLSQLHEFFEKGGIPCFNVMNQDHSDMLESIYELT